MSLTMFEENLGIARTDILYTTKQVVFGLGSISKVGEQAKQLGGKKALVVTDKILRKILADQIVESLKKQGLTSAVFDDIPGEPTVETLRSAASYVRESKFDVVVGVGGGAVIDTAKTCAIMATNPGDVKDYVATVEAPFEDHVKIKGLPLIVSPTTSGTGSENTGGIMVIDGDYKTWIAGPLCFPDVAIVDPALTLTLPPKMTAGSGMDALSHAIEAYMITALANPWIDAFALEATRLITQNLRTAYHDGKNLQARYNMSWAAHLGGWVAMATSGPATLGHCLSEALGSKYKIPHGTICGICLPHVMEFNLPAIMGRLASIASAMGEDITGLRPRDAALAAVRAVVELMKDTDIPVGLKAFRTPVGDIPKLAEYVVKDRQRMYLLAKLHPRKLTVENLTQTLENMWEGRLGESSA